MKVALWHGVTPMLLLSATVLGIGALLFVYWVPIHRRLRTETLLDRYETEHAYDPCFDVSTPSLRGSPRASREPTCAATSA